MATLTMTIEDQQRAARAVVSACGTYRYTLERAWASLPRYVLWLMLNPSTADALRDDATIRRCIGYAKAWGYTGILVGNLYATRATDPRNLDRLALTGADVIGPENERHVRGLMARADLLVCAWGRLGPTTSAQNKALQLFRPPCRLDPHFLKLNKSGEPAHPLRLPAALKPTRWNIWDQLNSLGAGHGS